MGSFEANQRSAKDDGRYDKNGRSFEHKLNGFNRQTHLYRPFRIE